MSNVEQKLEKTEEGKEARSESDLGVKELNEHDEKMPLAFHIEGEDGDQSKLDIEIETPPREPTNTPSPEFESELAQSSPSPQLDGDALAQKLRISIIDSMNRNFAMLSRLQVYLDRHAQHLIQSSRFINGRKLPGINSIGLQQEGKQLASYQYTCGEMLGDSLAGIFRNSESVMPREESAAAGNSVVDLVVAGLKN